MSRSPSPAWALAAVLVAAVTACGASGPPPEIVTGTVPAGQSAVTLPGYPPQSVGDGDEWPRACELLTEAEVLAVLPQATRVRREPRGEQFTYKLVGSGTYDTPQAPRGNPYAQPRTIDVPEKSCETWTYLPSDDEEGHYATVEVTVDMVGSPDTVFYFFSPPDQDDVPLPDAFGAEVCYEQVTDDPEPANVSTFLCRKGPMSVRVVGIIEDVEEGSGVRLPGDATTSSRQAVVDWYRTQVVPQFVGAVARRMP